MTENPIQETVVPIEISHIIMPAISFAMQQNHIPFIRQLIIKNNTESTLKDISVDISFEPLFATPFSARLDELAPNSSVEIAPLRIILSTDCLFSLTERILGTISCNVSSQGETIASSVNEISLLAYDQWLGIDMMPELTGAFVTPNSQSVSQIISNASIHLNKWTNSPSFVGYQRNNPNDVRIQMAAIYAAMQEQNIAYTMPPASFGVPGQRVRMPSDVLEQKMGTCLDLSLLYASCLEACSLHPLIIFIKGHAFCGCWLENETFPECTVDDFSAITKRTSEGINSICLVDCVDFVAGSSVDFEHSQKHANDYFTNPAVFDMAIDITRCRNSSILPLPIRINENGVFKAADFGERSKKEITDAPKELKTISGTINTERIGEITKQVIWERKLLDLNLRNSLLNFRATGSSVQLMTADLAILEDEISKGESFKIMPMPQEVSISVRDAKIFEIETERDLITTIAQTEFQNHRLRTFMSEPELQKSLKKLHRTAKQSIEENGANTLYLALGFLRWYESDLSEKARLAPIVLIPIDIIRRLSDKSYSLRIRDEELQMNITLLEMLRQDFGIRINGLNPLPCDESGVNLPLVFNTLRQGIMEKKRWDIVDYAFVGQFSFSRFIMWNDIRNRSEELKTNKTVASLISGNLTWTPKDLDKDPQELDFTLMPSEMAIPMSTDSSQLSAIYQASNGQSFVLHGPPGTGKSQTITNMIANALYQGKTVLFVAEKMAALTVVQRRLASIGLGDFCLEIHSNKAQKRAVLKQLEATLALKHTKSAQNFESTAQKLFDTRTQLNDMMEQIHKKQNFGFSLYDAITRFERAAQHKGLLKIDKSIVLECDPQGYQRMSDIIHETSISAESCGDISSSFFLDYQNRTYSIEMRDRLNASAQKYIACLDRLTDTLQNFTTKTGLEIKEYSDIITLSGAITVAAKSASVLKAVLYDSRFDTLRDSIENLINTSASLELLKSNIDRDFDQAVYLFDANTAALKLKAAQQKWVLAKMLGISSLVKELNLYAKGITITKDNIQGYYNQLIEYSQKLNLIKNCDATVASFLADVWIGENTKPQALKLAYDNSVEIRSFINLMKLDYTQKSQLAEMLMHLSTSSSPDISEAMQNACTEIMTLKACENELHDCGINFIDIHSANDWIAHAKQTAQGWCENITGLREWVAFLCCCDKLKSCGLVDAVDGLFDGRISGDTLADAFECSFCMTAASNIISVTPSLSTFRGDAFDDTIQKYKQAIAEFEALTIQELVARLSAKIPDVSSGGAASSEISILQKAIKSGGRMLSIRKLFDSIPNLLRQICPCMLMSPISCAQYIDPSFPKFDIVIFDEASQMPTCEAVGAIARGDNVVVVGDPKQLPPTSFFSSNQIDEENYEKEDLESVLDDCLALMMPQRHLLWHYRSRHESLIAYSNAKYYDNKLLTFPSPDDLVSEVTHVQCDGFYDRSGTKQNDAEAKEIVNEIIRRLRDEKLRHESIGVVTFSVVQQNLIDDMLNDAFSADPHLEELASELPEPIFIKNLENVQGDERDIILFSICYGPDKDGRVSMNFGPVNRDGGWRRLNVAISRSRKKMIVFSTIRPEQIDLSRTRSEGVAGLKGFLEYAVRGKNALNPTSAQTLASESGFVNLVAEEIEKLGYKTKCNIGASEYKIDIGIIDPENEGEYILGVMCDGKQHFENSTARDRHVLQPSVLRGLGWQIFTVYILDWLDDKKKIINKLKVAIEQAFADQEPDPEPIVLKVEPVFEEAEPMQEKNETSTYAAFTPSVLGNSEDFYSEEAVKKIKLVLSNAIEMESPISKKMLYKKVLNAWGMSRGGAKIDRRIEEQLGVLNVIATSSSYNTFIWKAGQMPSEYTEFRVPQSDEQKRAIDDIAPQEIANAIVYVIKHQFGLERQDLIRETAKLFGYTRLGGVIEAAVDEGIACAKFKGLITQTDNKITLAE